MRAAARRQLGLVTTAQCVAAGMSRKAVRTRADRRAWVRVTTGVYDVDPARTRELDPGGLRRRAAVLGLLAYGPDAVAVGTAALALHGLWGLPVRIRPQVALADGDSRRSRDGILVRRFAVPVVERTRDGHAVAPLDVALAQAVPELDRDHAVAVLDSAVNLGLLTAQDLEHVRSLVRGRRGAERVAGWWSLVDGRSESTYETFARLECRDAGLPPDDLQVRLRRPDGGEARGDLGWRIDEDHWLLAEIEGKSVHGAPGADRRDRRRQNGITLTGGATFLRYDPGDVRTGLVPAEVRLALDAHRRHAA
ncbi:conserved hypothetical protein [Beutenbergia cavernae DSM 12333]|uniref:DUF559 domain-containing protein n=1 Tax=Beutenbergia cavernae (strain ATCC BAA-8 / DSM 12333 / CCUG 43141 / JCM 11478 / NBRC 16432 / NCIMB 13614 / HKI 0122) TaxID=471853 RepID=C5BXB5_BEUC1|nr:conserved hypothetical protein [Beutenbergia cavernae DSM 12333]